MGNVGQRLEMKLETQRLELRSATPEDAPHLLAIWSNPDVLRHLPPMARMTSLDEAKLRVERRRKLEAERGYAPLIVCEKDTGEKIGSGGLQAVGGQGPDAELAYAFLPSAWGKGYATEAALAILDFGFNTRKLEEILAFVIPGNDASCRVLEKAGMKYAGMASYPGLDGQVKKYVAVRGTWTPPKPQM